MESWTDVKIIIDGDQYYNEIIDSIDSARNSVTLESYIFDIDPLTQRVLEALARARTRNCRVSLLVDGVGSYKSISYLKIYCLQQDIFFSVFHPVPFIVVVAAKLFARSTQFFDRMNSRNHRKIVVIDSQIAFLGSFNFAQYHCKSYVKEKAWRDTGVRVEGPLAIHLTGAFTVSFVRTLSKDFVDWLSRWKIRTPASIEGINLNTTKKMRKLWYRRLVRTILRSEKRVYITTAYFLPRRSLTQALKKAQQRGVDVRIIIPGKSDTNVVRWAGQSLIEYLTDKNVKIYEYQPSILHAKTMIIDDTAYIGSFNFNHRSILHDLEVELSFDEPSVVSELTSIWEKDLGDSKLLTSENLKQSSFLKRLLYKIAFRMRYML